MRLVRHPWIWPALAAAAALLDSASARAVTQSSVNISFGSNPGIPGDTNEHVFVTVYGAAPNGSYVTGTVSLMDGSTSLGTVTLGPGAFLIMPKLTPGTHHITGSFPGNADNSPSTGSADLAVNASTTTSLTGPSPAAANKTISFWATVAAGSYTVPGGQVRFMDGTAVLGTANVTYYAPVGYGLAATPGGMQAPFNTMLAAGAHSITAQYLGADGYTVSTSPPFSVSVVNLTTTTMGCTCSGTATTSLGANAANACLPGPVGAVSGIYPFNCHANVFTTNANGAMVPITTGSVSMKVGSTVLQTVTLDGSGQANFGLTSVPGGSSQLVASYNGDANDRGSSSAPFYVQNQGVTTTSSSAPSGTVFAYGTQAPLTLAVTVTGASPTGQVYVCSGSTPDAPGTQCLRWGQGGVNLTNGAATINVSGALCGTWQQSFVGAKTFYAQYYGDKNNSASSGAQAYTIYCKSPTSPGSLSATGSGGTRTFNAIFTPYNQYRGTVTFRVVGGNTLGSANLQMGNASITASLPNGTFQIAADYSGTDESTPASAPPIAVTVP